MIFRSFTGKQYLHHRTHDHDHENGSSKGNTEQNSENKSHSIRKKVKFVSVISRTSSIILI